MGLIISTKQQIDDYFNNPALGQSSLKSLIGGLDSFLTNREETPKMFYEEKGHFIIGSGVDCILTGEEGQFEKEYHLSNIEKKPTDTIMSIINLVFAMVKDMAEMEEVSLETFLLNNGNDLELYGECILMACNEHEYSMTWKSETRVNKVLETGKEYFKDLQNGEGKQILDQEQYFKINDIVMSLKTNSVTAPYFNRQEQEITNNTDFYYQLPIYFTYKEIACKALLDLVCVYKDEEGSIIAILPIDLKTMGGKTIQFNGSLVYRRYDIQAAWYTLALQNFFGVEKIRPFTFIVESTIEVGQPLVYKCHPSLLEMGKKGRPEMKYGNITSTQTPFLIRNEIKGYETLVDEYLWYEENGWEKERKIAENQGVLELSWNGIM